MKLFAGTYDGTNAQVEAVEVKYIDKAPTVSQGERAERALAIIDRLRADGYINNKEQGTLRRAILLPERPQGEWIIDEFGRKICGKCQFPFAEFQSNNYCSLCGAYMMKEAENNES